MKLYRFNHLDQFPDRTFMIYMCLIYGPSYERLKQDNILATNMSQNSITGSTQDQTDPSSLCQISKWSAIILFSFQKIRLYYTFIHIAILLQEPAIDSTRTIYHSNKHECDPVKTVHEVKLHQQLFIMIECGVADCGRLWFICLKISILENSHGVMMKCIKGGLLFTTMWVQQSV